MDITTFAFCLELPIYIQLLQWGAASPVYRVTAVKEGKGMYYTWCDAQGPREPRINSPERAKSDLPGNAKTRDEAPRPQPPSPPSSGRASRASPHDAAAAQSDAPPGAPHARGGSRPGGA